MAGKMNIKEFAEAVGVSTGTISRAFSDKGRISPATRERIRREAERLGYRANLYASRLTSSQSDIIGFFYPSIGNCEPDYFIDEIMLGVNKAAVAVNKSIQIHPFTGASINQLDVFKEYLLNGSLAGVIIVAGSPISVKLVSIAKSGGIPYIVIGQMYGELDNTVAFDIETGAFQAGQYYLETGRSAPAYIGGFLDNRKKRGFLKGLGGELSEAVIFDKGGDCFSHGGQAFDRIIASRRNTDCVFCANDVLAIGFMRQAFSCGLKIPEQLAVIGCDDLRISRFYIPALTTIALHEYEVGNKAISQLLRVIGGEKIHRKTIGADLILRESA